MFVLMRHYTDVKIVELETNEMISATHTFFLCIYRKCILIHQLYKDWMSGKKCFPFH